MTQKLTNDRPVLQSELPLEAPPLAAKPASTTSFSEDGGVKTGCDWQQFTRPAAATVAEVKRAGAPTISAFGIEFPRLAPAITAPLRLENGLARTLSGLFSDGKLLGEIGHRTEGAVSRALFQPLIEDTGGALTGTTVYRPGLGNTKVGPELIGRLAQYSDRVVIAYANPGSSAQQKLRKVSEISPVLAGLELLPKALLDKLWVIGSPEPIMVSYLQASDLLLPQLDAIGAEGVNIVAHSQGGNDAVHARDRLERAGRGDVIRKLYTLASPFEGSLVSDELLAGVVSEAASLIAKLQAAAAINQLDPDAMGQSTAALADRLVDVSLVGRINPVLPGSWLTRGLFKVTSAAIAGASYLKYSPRANQDHLRLTGLRRDEAARLNDGLVSVGSQLHGKQAVWLPDSYDHARIAESAKVIDALVYQMSRSSPSSAPPAG